MQETYNGWTNYETWRTNLELFDGMTAEDMGIRPTPETADHDIDSLADILKNHAHDIVDAEAPWTPGRYSFSHHIVLGFLRSVDWREIADHMVTDSIAELV